MKMTFIWTFILLNSFFVSAQAKITEKLSNPAHPSIGKASVTLASENFYTIRIEGEAAKALYENLKTIGASCIGSDPQDRPLCSKQTKNMRCISVLNRKVKATDLANVDCNHGNYKSVTCTLTLKSDGTVQEIGD